MSSNPPSPTKRKGSALQSSAKRSKSQTLKPVRNSDDGAATSVSVVDGDSTRRPSLSKEELAQYKEDGDSGTDNTGTARLLSSLLHAKAEIERLQSKKTGRGQQDDTGGDIRVAVERLNEYIDMVENGGDDERMIGIAGSNGDGKSELLQFILRATEQTPRSYERGVEEPHHIWQKIMNLVKKDRPKQSKKSKKSKPKSKSKSASARSSAAEKASTRFRNHDAALETLAACLDLKSKDFPDQIRSALEDAKININVLSEAVKVEDEARALNQAEAHMYDKALGDTRGDVVNFILPKALEKSATTTNGIYIRYGHSYGLMLDFKSKDEFVSAISELYHSIPEDQLDRHRQQFEAGEGSLDAFDDYEDDVAAGNNEDDSKWTSLALLQYLVYYTTNRKEASPQEMCIGEDFDPENLKFIPDIEKNFGTVKVTLGRSGDILADRAFVRKALQDLSPCKDGEEVPLTCIINEITLYVPSVILQDGRVLVDLPGFNDVNPLRKMELSRGLEACDVIVALIRRSWESASDTQRTLREAGCDASIRAGRQQLLVLQCNEKTTFKNLHQILSEDDPPEENETELRRVFGWLYPNRKGPALNQIMQSERRHVCQLVPARFFLAGCILRKLQQEGNENLSEGDARICGLKKTNALKFLEQLEKMSIPDMVPRLRNLIMEDFRLFRTEGFNIEAQALRNIATKFTKRGRRPQIFHDLKEMCKRVVEKASQKDMWRGYVPEEIGKLLYKQDELAKALKARKLVGVSKTRQGVAKVTGGRSGKLHTNVLRALNSVFNSEFAKQLKSVYDREAELLGQSTAESVAGQIDTVLAPTYKEGGGTQQDEAYKGLIRSLSSHATELMISVATSDAVPRTFRKIFSAAVDYALYESEFRLDGSIDEDKLAERLILGLKNELEQHQAYVGKQFRHRLVQSKRGKLWKLLTSFFRGIAEPKISEALRGLEQQLQQRLAEVDKKPDEPKDISKHSTVLLRRRAGITSKKVRCFLKVAANPVRRDKVLQSTIIDDDEGDAKLPRLNEHPSKADVDKYTRALSDLVKSLRLIDSRQLAMSRGYSDFVTALSVLFKVPGHKSRESCSRLLSIRLMHETGEHHDPDGCVEIERGLTVRSLRAFVSLFFAPILVHVLDDAGALKETFHIQTGLIDPEIPANAYQLIVYKGLVFTLMDERSIRQE